MEDNRENKRRQDRAYYIKNHAARSRGRAEKSFVLVLDTSGDYAKEMRFSYEEVAGGLPNMNFEDGSVLQRGREKYTVMNNSLVTPSGRVIDVKELDR